MATATRHLLIGNDHPFTLALGQALLDRYGLDNVMAIPTTRTADETIIRHQVTDVYMLASPFAPSGPEEPAIRWHRHTRELATVLDLAVAHDCRVFYPSSIHVFGGAASAGHYANDAPQEPASLFGMSKRAGERWCRQYAKEYDLDVRSLRFPIVLAPDVPGVNNPPPVTTPLPVTDQPRPVLHLEDAVRATIELMAAPKASIRERGSYNLAGPSVSVADLLTELQQHNPRVRLDVWNLPDEPGPSSLDDSAARTDWGWKPRYDLLGLVRNLLH